MLKLDAVHYSRTLLKSPLSQLKKNSRDTVPLKSMDRYFVQNVKCVISAHHSVLIISSLCYPKNNTLLLPFEINREATTTALLFRELKISYFSPA